MLGYVKVNKPELKVRESEVYDGYYCGICKYIGSEYGQLPRMALSFDAAFLAIVLASLDETPDEPRQEHCIIHHIKKRTIIQNRAVEYAGDVMLVLAWYKLLDDAKDEGKTSAKVTIATLKRIYKKLRNRHTNLCKGIENYLKELRDLEERKCDNLDMAAESFSKIMEIILVDGIDYLYKPAEMEGEGEKVEDTESFGNLHETFAKVGYHLGKWIYIIDALDDIEDNLETGSYNPLIQRYKFDFGHETAEDFRTRIDDAVKFNLYHYLAQLGELIDTIDIKKNKGIIENVVFGGLNRKTEEILTRVDPKKQL